MTMTVKDSPLATCDETDRLAVVIRSGEARLIALDTVNPYGGRGGSIDSWQCAWLVRALAASSTERVVITTRHRSRDLLNTRAPEGASARVLGPELASILLAHDCVAGWVGGYRHRPQVQRHGDVVNGFWEATPSALGLLRRVLRGAPSARWEACMSSVRQDFPAA
jgi:hypothetical protein